MIDSALRPGVEPEQWQERIPNDGSRHRVYKRYLTASGLAEELRGEVCSVAPGSSWSAPLPVLAPSRSAPQPETTG